MLQRPDFELGPGIRTLMGSKMFLHLSLKGVTKNHLCSILIFVTSCFSLTSYLGWLRLMFAKGVFALQLLVLVINHSSAPVQWL